MSDPNMQQIDATIAEATAQREKLSQQHQAEMAEVTAFEQRVAEIGKEADERRSEIAVIRSQLPELMAAALLGEGKAALKLSQQRTALEQAQTFVMQYETAYPVLLTRIYDRGARGRGMAGELAALYSRLEELHRLREEAVQAHHKALEAA